MSPRMQSAARDSAVLGSDGAALAPAARLDALLAEFAPPPAEDLRAQFTPQSGLTGLIDAAPLAPEKPAAGGAAREMPLALSRTAETSRRYADTLAIREVPLSELRAMSVERLAALSEQQMRVMTGAQLQVVRERCDELRREGGLAAAERECPGILRVVMLADRLAARHVPPGRAGADVLARLIAADLEGMGDAAIAEMGGRIRAVPPIVFCCLGDDHLRAIPVEGIQALTDGQLQALSEKQLLAFTPAQRTQFRPEQRRGRLEQVWQTEQVQAALSEAAGADGNLFDRALAA